VSFRNRLYTCTGLTVTPDQMGGKEEATPQALSFHGEQNLTI